MERNSWERNIRDTKKIERKKKKLTTQGGSNRWQRRKRFKDKGKNQTMQTFIKLNCDKKAKKKKKKSQTPSKWIN